MVTIWSLLFVMLFSPSNPCYLNTVGMSLLLSVFIGSTGALLENLLGTQFSMRPFLPYLLTTHLYNALIDLISLHECVLCALKNVCIQIMCTGV